MFYFQASHSYINDKDFEESGRVVVTMRTSVNNTEKQKPKKPIKISVKYPIIRSEPVSQHITVINTGAERVRLTDSFAMGFGIGIKLNWYNMGSFISVAAWSVWEFSIT